jgi:hypothetical protein
MKEKQSQKMQGYTVHNIATLNYEPWAKLKFGFELPEKSTTSAEKIVERKMKQSQLTETQCRETSKQTFMESEDESKEEKANNRSLAKFAFEKKEARTRIQTAAGQALRTGAVSGKQNNS